MKKEIKCYCGHTTYCDCIPSYNTELFEYLHNELGVIALDSQLKDIEEMILNTNIKKLNDGN
jgi:hypothetical protein